MTSPAPRTGAGLTYLRNGQFARLFGSRLITNFGSVMSPIAIAFGVLQLTGSAQQTSLVVAAQVTAQVLVLLFGGALADRGHRQRILVGADLLAAGSQAAVAALFLSGHAHITLLVLLALSWLILIRFAGATAHRQVYHSDPNRKAHQSSADPWGRYVCPLERLRNCGLDACECRRPSRTG